MAALYPMLMQPEFVPRVWGARDLRPIYRVEPAEAIGEAWLTGDRSRVSNGEFAGTSLGELCARLGSDLVGPHPQDGRFPLLIKFLFPREKLSVQVHPDDAMARGRGEPCGKTECWYVVSAEPGARVAVGLKAGVSKQEFRRAAEAGRAEELLRWMDVAAGELVYVPAGTVHAIGPGSVLVETQQNSDTTFRLYDYGRPRELHLEQGMAAMKEHTDHGKADPYAVGEAGGSETLIDREHFRVERWRVSEPALLGASRHGRDEMSVLVCLDGGCALEAGSNGRSGEAVEMTRGSAVVLPASLGAARLVPRDGRAELLRMCVGSSG